MNNKIIIRKMEEKDIIKIQNINLKVLRTTLAPFYEKQILDTFIRSTTRKNIQKKSKDHTYIIAEDQKNRKIFGFIAIKENEITSFGIHPTYQQQGIGKKLFEKAENIISSNKHSEITVDSSPYAVKIYERFGFKKQKKIKKPINNSFYTDTRMTKKIKKDQNKSNIYKSNSSSIFIRTNSNKKRHIICRGRPVGQRRRA